MDLTLLRILQGLDLNLKIKKSMQRIDEAIDKFGVNGLYVSVSGGKDSTVMHDLILRVEKERFGKMQIQRIFCDTGLEYPEIKEWVYNLQKEYGKDYVRIIRPSKTFKEVLDEYGYPVVSKEQSRYLWDIKNSTQFMKDKRLKGNSKFRLSKKHYYLMNAPFKISHKCCDVMKKSPFKSLEHAEGKVPMIGVLAEESIIRMQAYVNTGGCNAFNNARPQSRPIGFWTEQDILKYLLINKIEIAKCYKKIKLDKKTDKYVTTGIHRSGCIWCLYGIEEEQKNGKNRLEKLKVSHRSIYNYCMEKLGFKEICDFMNIRY